jgi:putative transposase
VLIDETGSQLQGDLGHTWAPRGQTPTIITTSQRQHISIIGGITPQGNIFSQKWLGSINSFLFMLFLKYLLQQIPGQGQIVVVLDNSPIHKSALIRNFVAQNPRLDLIYTPPYAPESNPIEWLWAWVKQRLRSTSFPNADTLAASWKSKLASARKTNGLIRAFFTDSLLAPLCP